MNHHSLYVHFIILIGQLMILFIFLIDLEFTITKLYRGLDG